MLKLGCCAEGSEGGDMDRLEELPLCSCRMEAPQVDSSSQPASRACMATESINGAVGAPCLASATVSQRCFLPHRC